MATFHNINAALYPINASALNIALLATPVRYVTMNIHATLLAHQAVGIERINCPSLLRLQYIFIVVMAQRSPLPLHILIIVSDHFFFDWRIRNSNGSALQFAAQQSRNVLRLDLRRQLVAQIPAIRKRRTKTDNRYRHSVLS